MLSDEEKKAIEYWKRDIKFYHYNTQLASEHYAQILLNLIQKQDKIIDKMAEKMVEDKDWFYSEFDNYTKQDFIEYFKKVVDEDVKD